MFNYPLPIVAKGWASAATELKPPITVKALAIVDDSLLMADVVNLDYCIRSVRSRDQVTTNTPKAVQS
jgi:hypothetical protein